MEFTARDSNGAAYDRAGQFQVKRYLTLDPRWGAGAGDFDPSRPGFVGRINQIAVARGPGDASLHWNAARQLAGGYLDPSTGEAYPNLVNPGQSGGGVDAEGNFELPDGAMYREPWINFNQDVLADPPTERGEFTSEDDPRFRDDPIPGIPGQTGSTDHFVMEAFGYVQLEAPRLYTFVVNSDEGFRASFGPQLRSILNTDFEVSQFSDQAFVQCPVRRGDACRRRRGLSHEVGLVGRQWRSQL